MKDYLIIVEGFDHITGKPVHTERLIDKSEDYAQGMLKAFKIFYPKNEVYLEEIKKV